MLRERTSVNLAITRVEGRVGGRSNKVDPAKRRKIAESVITGRESGAGMARLYNVSQPMVSRIVAPHRSDTTRLGARRNDCCAPRACSGC